MILAASVVIVAVLLILSRILFSYADYYHAAFGRWASYVIGRPVNIEHVTASWYGLDPIIQFDNVQILDGTGKNVLLQLKTLRISINFIQCIFKLEIYTGMIIRHRQLRTPRRCAYIIIGD